jgi:carbamoyl-phosphate synthase small subunit
MLSNGPGDPSDDHFEIEQIQKLFKSGVSMFGICLGHQLLALSQGAKTYKLKYGHRGINQSVKFVENDKVYITSQNHGYAVDSDSLPKDKAEVLFFNVNDNTCEGVAYKGANVFSVQFHPEASAGPMDTEFLFDKFITNIKKNKG